MQNIYLPPNQTKKFSEIFHYFPNRSLKKLSITSPMDITLFSQSKKRKRRRKKQKKVIKTSSLVILFLQCAISECHCNDKLFFQIDGALWGGEGDGVQGWEWGGGDVNRGNRNQSTNQKRTIDQIYGTFCFATPPPPLRRMGVTLPSGGGGVHCFCPLHLPQ